MRSIYLFLACWFAFQTFAAQAPKDSSPLFRVVDLNRGETAQVQLADGKRVHVKLMDVAEARDPIRSAVRLAQVTLEIDGEKLTVDSGNYRLPVNGNDIGGCEGLIDVISACDGLVVSARGQAMEGYTNAPFYKPHGDYDYVYVLDGHSWSSTGEIKTYEWNFTDGSTATGARVERHYEKPGAFSEVLKVIDARGRIGYDVATVQVFAKGQTNNFPPTIHAAHAPTFNIHAGDPVTFKVRTFRTSSGRERWDFGDGSPSVEVQSDGNAKPLGKDGYAVMQHRYAKPGHYIARVERTNARGETAVARLVIEVVNP